MDMWNGLLDLLNENVSRTHLGLNKDSPIHRKVCPDEDGVIQSIPQVGGLHHRYERFSA